MITKHLRYLSYVVRHKWYVGIECFKHGLFWRGLTHDLSKFRPSEWFAYANHFYGRETTKKDGVGYSKGDDAGDAPFDYAWLLHQKRQDHHHQWWLVLGDDGTLKAVQMSKHAGIEMLCDWIGASKAQGFDGKGDLRNWYEKNKGNMRLHECTRSFVEVILARL